MPSRRRKPARRAPRKKPDAGTPEAYLVASLAQYEQMAVDAEEDESWNAAVSAKKEAVKTRADLDRLRETQKKIEVPASREEHKAELLATVRRLRIGAEEAGSYIAADKLLRAEREFVRLAEEEERLEREAKLKLRSREDLLEEIARLQAERGVH